MKMLRGERIGIELQRVVRILHVLLVKLVFFCVLLLSREASSEDYYWLFNTIYTPGKFASPVEPCNIIKKHNEEYYGEGFSHRVITSVISPSRFYCEIGFHYYNWSPDYWVSEAYIVHRYGDSCPSNKKYNEVTGLCDPRVAGIGISPTLSCVADPINVLNGNMFEVEVDFRSKTSLLLFSRTYNSLDGIWRHSYSDKLSPTAGAIVRTSSDGQEFSYKVNGAAIDGESIDLGVMNKFDGGWVYTSEKGEEFTFDAVGRLIKQRSSAGKIQLLSYVGNAVTVTDELGGSLTFTENYQGQPLTLSAAGLTVQYHYNS